MDIADKIKQLRTNLLHLKQKELANKMNVTRQTIKNWENGSMKPNLSNIKLLAYCFGVTTDYLIDDNCSFELCTRDIGDIEYNILNSLIEYFENENNLEDK